MAVEIPRELEVRSATIIKVIVILLAVFFLYAIWDVLIILFLAIMLSSAVNPFAIWMAKRKIPRILSVVVLYIAFFGVLGFILSLIVPVLSFELNQLTEFLPNFFTEISSALETAQQQAAIESKYLDFFDEILLLFDSVAEFLNISSQSFLSLIVNVFGGVLSFVAIIVISFYLAIMPKGTSEFIRSVLPDKYENYVIRLWKKSERKVGRWLQAQILLAMAVGLLVFIGLSILNVKYAMVLAVIAMILELVPVAGPIIAAIPAVFLAFSQSPGLAFGVLILYFIVQQIESNFLTPLIMGRRLGLNPITVIIALLIGFKVAGILGILIAVPVAVVVVEILDDLAKEREKRKEKLATSK